MRFRRAGFHQSVILGERRTPDTQSQAWDLFCPFSGWVLSPNERRTINLYGVFISISRLLGLPRWHRFNPWVGKIPSTRKWQHTPVFLPRKPHGQRSLVGYSPWGCKESDTTERLSHRRIKNWYLSWVHAEHTKCQHFCAAESVRSNTWKSDTSWPTLVPKVSHTLLIPLS